MIPWTNNELRKIGNAEELRIATLRCDKTLRKKVTIWAGGVEKNVTFVEETDPAINDRIDEAYLAKYGRYPQYVKPMVTPKVRSATIKLVPHGTSA